MRRAASISVAICAIWNWIPWNSLILLPELFALLGIFRGKLPCAPPEPLLPSAAPIPMRPSFNVSIAILLSPYRLSPIHVVLRHAAIFQNQFAGGRCANSQLVFFLADSKSGKIFFNDECRNPLVSRHDGSTVAKQNKDARFFAVGDPQLPSIEDVVASLQFRFGLQRKRVRARTGFAESIGSASVGGHARQIAFLLFVVGPAQ